MTESGVESGIEQDVLKPSIKEFTNFSKFIKTLEDKNLSFALVGIPFIVIHQFSMYSNNF